LLRGVALAGELCKSVGHILEVLERDDAAGAWAAMNLENDVIKLSSEKTAFYQEHLDRVSRSFAFCIARLESPLREQVGLGYLLCRIVDTIEDASWAEFADQDGAFASFDLFLSNPASRSEIRSWVDRFPTGIPESEKLLLRDAHLIFADFHSLPEPIRQALLKPIRSMSAGMRFFMARKAKEGKLQLADLAEVNGYCFFVAGVVGEMLTNLLLAGRALDGGRDTEVSMSDAFSFGLFLQKVNLLKDQRGDEREGRFLIPSRGIVRKSLELNAERAIRYVLSLPVRLTGFRVFCSWSLFLGIASLPWIDRSHAEDSALKISREETALLLEEVEERVGNNESLRSLFDTMMEDLRSMSSLPHVDTVGVVAPRRLRDEARLLELYSGDLPRELVLELFYGS
jgi:phytoene/squalene synthetase